MTRPCGTPSGPRLAAIYDLDGGKTALKFSVGRYYYIIGPGTANNINPNFSVSKQYAWNDLNKDLKYQPGEETGVPVQAGGLTTSFDPDFRRPYTDEITGGVDRELLPSLRLSAVFTWRSERYQQASLNTASPLDTWVLVTAPDLGADGLAGTVDDGTYQYYNRTIAGSRTLITNDPESNQTYKGLEITATKRMSNRWQVLAGYTYSKAEYRDITVGTSPNAFLNTEGVIFNDRPHQFKVTGSYLLPWDLYLGANYRFQNGPPINRQTSAPLNFGGSSRRSTWIHRGPTGCPLSTRWTCGWPRRSGSVRGRSSSTSTSPTSRTRTRRGRCGRWAGGSTCARTAIRTGR